LQTQNISAAGSFKWQYVQKNFPFKTSELNEIQALLKDNLLQCCRKTDRLLTHVINNFRLPKPHTPESKVCDYCG